MHFSTVFLAALTTAAVYMVGISLMTTQVTYPLYASVPTGAFVSYHARYNRRILPVIIVPGFPTFLAGIAFPFLRPEAVPLWASLLVAAGGATALLATVSTAIPAHASLQRDGFTPVAYHRLRAADAVRTVACLVSATVLVGCVLTSFTPR